MENSLLKTFVTLIFSVSAIGLLLFLIKKYFKKNSFAKNSVELNIVSKIPLQPKSNLYIIKAGNKTLLIGATDHNISTLSVLNDDEENDLSEYNSLKPNLSSQLSVRKNDLNELKSEQDNISFGKFLKSIFRKSA